MFAAIVPSATFAEAKKERQNTLSRASTVESLSAILDKAFGYESECSSEFAEDSCAAAPDSAKSTSVVAQPTTVTVIEEVVVTGLEHQPCKTPVSVPKAVSIFGTVERPVCLRRLPSVQSSEKRMEEFRKPRATLFERAAAARLEKRRQQEAPATRQAIEKEVGLEASRQMESSLKLKTRRSFSERRETPIAGPAAAKPQPITVERSGSSKFARIHGLPSVRCPVAQKEETCEPQKIADVAKSSVSKFARMRSLPSARSPATPKGEKAIERREVKAVEKNSVKLPSINGIPPARSSSKVGQRTGKKDQTTARPKSAAMWQRMSKLARLPGLASTRLSRA